MKKIMLLLIFFKLKNLTNFANYFVATFNFFYCFFSGASQTFSSEPLEYELCAEPWTLG